MSVRLPVEARDKLLALSRLRGQPQWRLIVDSVECYIQGLPADERRAVDGLLNGRPKSGGRSRRR